VQTEAAANPQQVLHQGHAEGCFNSTTLPFITCQNQKRHMQQNHSWNSDAPPSSLHLPSHKMLPQSASHCGSIAVTSAM
jgi:hypothetical protein